MPTQTLYIVPADFLVSIAVLNFRICGDAIFAKYSRNNFAFFAFFRIAIELYHKIPLASAFALGLVLDHCTNWLADKPGSEFFSKLSVEISEDF